MTVHINRPSSTRFYARVRFEGHRKYIVVGGPTKSWAIAVKRMASKFSSGSYKRGDVIMTADYYDPLIVAEMSKP